MAKDNTDTQGGPRLPWAGKQVSLEQVESELTFLWHLAADNMRISQNINVRTSVLNFIICAPDTETARKASALLREVSSTHIGRVTILILNTGSGLPGGVTSWVTLRSFPIVSDIMRHHFEQVTIQATGSAVRSVTNIVQPLLKPDLPVYLWWLGDLPDDETIFHNLINISNRVIVDSSTFFKPEDGISKLSTTLQASNSALSDLNWARVTPWRELIAQFFDASDYRPYLQGVDQIEIEHAVVPSAGPTLTEQGDTSPNPTRALLLAAWLKTRLGWKLTANESYADHDTTTGTHTWQMTRIISPLTTRMLSVGSSRATKPSSLTEGKRSSTISIRPRVQPDLRPGTICLVRLTSTLDTKQATFTINREDGSDHVLTTVELEQESLPPRIVYIPTNRNQSTLLSDELEIMGRDHLYEETLQEVRTLLA